MAPQAGRISSRCTKVLISTCASLVSRRLPCEFRKGEIWKNTTGSSRRIEIGDRPSNDREFVCLDKGSFNTFVQRLGRIWALDGKDFGGVKA